MTQPGQTFIEDRYLPEAWVASAKEPAVFQLFMEKMVPKINLKTLSLSVLEDFANIDVTAEKIALSLKKNQYYENQFLNVIQSLGERKEQPSVESAIVLMGMQNSRNLILALQLMRSVTESHPEWKDGKLQMVPAEVVRFAIRAEDALAGKKDAYADTAYAAGLMWDYMAQLAPRFMDDPKVVMGFIEMMFNHGLRTAKVGVALCKYVPEFSFKKYVFAACLIHDIGKAVLAIADPTYPVVFEEMGKKSTPRELRYHLEQIKYGITHDLLGGLCCQYFRFFKTVEKAILYHHAPHLLMKQNKNLYLLAAVICLATRIANKIKIFDQPDDPIIKEWMGPELRDFKISPQNLIAVMKTVSKEL